MTVVNSNRFVNSTLSELQEANRNPIFGYQDLPILTLEKSIERIIPLVPDVVNNVAQAKKNCNLNSALLTPDESAAIYLYTSQNAFYARLNSALRAENRDALKPWFGFLQLFMTALNQLPSVQDTVWRGVHGDVGSQYVDNTVQIWWSVNSCSKHLKVVEAFVGGKGTVFRIGTVHGKDISEFSAYKQEKEVLLMPGTRLCVKSQLSSDKLLIIDLQEETTPSASQSVSEPSHLIERVRDEYKRNSRIERIMNPSKSFPIEQSYINLAIVETKEQQEKEKKLRATQQSDAIIGMFEEIYGAKTVIDVKDIFKNCKDQTKKVLVLGRAGIGKSTFCRYVAYQWATGAIWPEYKLVVLIPLRCLTDSRYPPPPFGMNYSLIDLVKKEYFPCDPLPEDDRRFFKQQCDQGQVLWLLDGYDEFGENMLEQLKDLFEHLRKTQHHILTSRPYLNTLSYAVQVEITGFTDNNITEYVKQFFDQITYELDDASIKGQKLLNFLKLSPSIWGVAHIPINLELICSLWSDADSSEAKELTITALYDNITEWLFRRYLTSQNIRTQMMSKHEVYDHCYKDLVFLETLGFNGIKNSTIIIRPALLHKVLKETDCSLTHHPRLLNIGILKSFNSKPTGNQIEVDKDHYFVHLSFQEYFAARYLVNAIHGSSCQQAIEFIKSHKYNQRFALVFNFASGLLIESDSEKSLDIFWDTIQGEPLDLVGLRHIQLVISCIEETNSKSSLRRRPELIDSITKWIKYAVTTKYDVILNQLKDSLRKSPSLAREPRIVDMLTSLLENKDPNTKMNASYIISSLAISNRHPQLIHALLKALGDESESVRRSACEALGEMGEKAATNEVISKLVTALGDGSEYVRQGACRVLGKMGEKAATNEVICRLGIALGDKSVWVRGSACGALGKMGEKAATNEVISRLLTAIGDESAYVRRGARKSLWKMREKAATNEVISRLATALGDKSENVRKSACEALGGMSEKAATNEMISRLVTALGDASAYVRLGACEALGKMGEKAATNEVISRLATALGDESENVRKSACEALGGMSEKAATNEVISRLVTAVGDESAYVRRSACEALGKIGEKAATNEVISRLVTALVDGSEWVRQSACKALGKMGEKAATNEVISRLVTALGDESAYVRQMACVALGEMGEKAATNEVISRLVTALGDECAYVRQSACKALRGMGERAATNEEIKVLLNALGDNDYIFQHVVAAALDKIFTSFSVMTELDPDILSNLALNKHQLDFLKTFPGDQFIKCFLHTKNTVWLRIVTLVTLLQGSAVTVTEETIVMYGDKEPVELHASSRELCQQLAEAFVYQAERLRLSSELP